MTESFTCLHFDSEFFIFFYFTSTVKAGKNELKRNSHEAHAVTGEQLTMDVFYRKLLLAMENKEPLTYSEHVYGFPERLLLPKGRKEGLPLQVFVHVMPCTAEDVSVTESPLWGKSIVDGHPKGFPLDRPIKAKNLIMPNMLFKDVTVFHKTIEEINATV